VISTLIVFVVSSVVVFFAFWQLGVLTQTYTRREPRQVATLPPVLLPPSDGMVRIWATVSCVRCMTDVIVKVSEDRAGARPEDWMVAALTDRHWARVNLPGEPVLWHCPDCIKSIKEVVYR
jgi:hypothetical protein